MSNKQLNLKLPPNVRCIAVTKRQSIEKIQWAISHGFTAFGENYCQEALPKIEYFRFHLLEWHFIGQIQSNKIKLIAQHFDWVQTVSRVDIAEKLNKARSQFDLPPLNVCIQINDAGIPNQAGIMFKQLPEIVGAILECPHLKWRGLMTMVREDYEKTAKTFYDLRKAGYDLDTLSMGMSQDYLVAIEKGANMVRLGTLLFGERK